MKRILVLASFLLISAPLARAQIHTQTLSFDDLGLGGGSAASGTYNTNDTFSFDVYLTFNGYDCYGYSWWLEVQTLNNFSASLFITGLTYGVAFPDPSQGVPNPAPFDAPLGAAPGYLTETRSLGALAAGEGPSFLPNPPGTYFIGHVSFAIIGAQPGTYILRSTTFSPHASEATDTEFMDNLIPAETYTITIVPEPSSLSLIGIGTLALIATVLRNRACKSHIFVHRH